VADVEELLALGIDICVLAAPTWAHAEIGLRLAAAGVHMLVEKPVASDVQSAQLVAIAFESQNLIGCVGHVERYNPAMLAMRARIFEGELGVLFQVATRRQGPFPGRIRDVGVVMDLATHDIDLTSWVVGSGYRKVSAVTAFREGRQHEDLVAVSGILLDGTVANHLVNWLSPVKERIVTITGTRGHLVADMVTSELWHHPGPGASAEAAISAGRPDGSIPCAVQKREPLRVELENFRDAVLGRPASIVTIRQGLAVVAVAEAVMAASHTETAVEPVTIAGTGYRAADVPAAPYPVSGLVPAPQRTTSPPAWPDARSRAQSTVPG
jgi:predicted dehydrogenase